MINKPKHTKQVAQVAQVAQGTFGAKHATSLC